jgi:hypothetical protein
MKTKKQINDESKHNADSASQILVDICYRPHGDLGATAACKLFIEKVLHKKMSDFTREEYASFIKETLESK